MKFKQIDPFLVQKIEKKVWYWIKTRRFRLPFFIFLVAIIIIFFKAPYINLFFNSYFIFFISLILAPFILDIDAKYFFILAVIFFGFAIMLFLLNKDELEMIGNYIFIFLFSGSIKMLFSSYQYKE